MPRGMKISADTIDEILAMAKESITPLNISKELDIAVTTVYRILGENGIDATRRRNRPELSEEAVAELIESYLLGSTARELRERHNLTPHHFYSLLAEAGIKPGQRAEGVKTEREVAMETAVEMYQDYTIPVWRIVQETEVSQPALTTELHRRGIELRRKARTRAQ